MALSESDTRAKLIDPAIHARGWTEDLIRREETSGAIDIVDGVGWRHLLPFRAQRLIIDRGIFRK
jgi:hypothetical protein